MNIIYKGEIPIQKKIKQEIKQEIKRFECYYCKTIFEADRGEYHGIGLKFGGKTDGFKHEYSAICPICNKNVYTSD